MPTDPRVIPYRVGVEGDPTSMLLALAEAHGVHSQVQEALDEGGTTKPPMVSLGQLLKRHRTAYGITIQEVHRRSNISRSQLSFYEGGQTKNPGLRTVQALSYGYRLPFISVLMAALHEIHPRMNMDSDKG